MYFSLGVFAYHWSDERMIFSAFPFYSTAIIRMKRRKFAVVFLLYHFNARISLHCEFRIQWLDILFYFVCLHFPSFKLVAAISCSFPNQNQIIQSRANGCPCMCSSNFISDHVFDSLFHLKSVDNSFLLPVRDGVIYAFYRVYVQNIHRFRFANAFI